MRITRPVASYTSSLPASQTQQNRQSAPRFGYITPLNPQNHPSATDTTGSSSLTPREVGVLMWAILFSVPTLAFGAYKISSWYNRHSQNRHMSRRHEHMLATVESAHQNERRNAVRLENIRRPENAVVRDR